MTLPGNGVRGVVADRRSAPAARRSRRVRIRAVGTVIRFGDALRRAVAFVVDEEERAVVRDRAAEAAAELVLRRSGFARGEEAARVELSLRTNSNAVPWKSLVPDLVMMLMTPPSVRPISAE